MSAEVYKRLTQGKSAHLNSNRRVRTPRPSTPRVPTPRELMSQNSLINRLRNIQLNTISEANSNPYVDSITTEASGKSISQQNNNISALREKLQTINATVQRRRSMDTVKVAIQTHTDIAPVRRNQSCVSNSRKAISISMPPPPKIEPIKRLSRSDIAKEKHMLRLKALKFTN